MRSVSRYISRLPQSCVRYVLAVLGLLICLSSGLWIHHIFLNASAEWSAMQENVESLEEAAKSLRDHAANSSAFRKRAVALYETDGDIIAVFDRAQRLKWASADDLEQRLTDLSLASWAPLNAQRSGCRAGPLSVDGQAHVGIAWDLPNGGSAAILRSESAFPVSVKNYRSALPSAAMVAITWILALQILVGWLLLSHVHRDANARQNQADSRSLQQARDLVRTQDAIILGMARLAESRDSETGLHLERITMLSALLATALQRRCPELRSEINAEFIRLIGSSSALHDIGKVGVADAVLSKPAALTLAEARDMQQHTLIGAKCLQQIERRLGSTNFLQMAREICLSHHERWDGTGYPQGIKGSCIPLAARIVAVVDVYDALANARIYKPAYAHERCIEIIKDGAGSQFDPRIVDVFVAEQHQFRDVIARFGDTQPLNEKPTADSVHPELPPIEEFLPSPSGIAG